MQAYRLVAIEIGDRLAGGARSAHESALGVYSSVKKAEAMIRIHMEKNARDGIPMLGYVLYENAVDDLALRGPWKCIPAFMSVRTYLADGTLNAVCECDDACEKKWYGRDVSTIKFKSGDFVKVWLGSRIEPMLVAGSPISRDEKIVGDWSDDCYLAYPVTGGHCHPFVPYVFPVDGGWQLSSSTKRKLLAVRDQENAPKRTRRSSNNKQRRRSLLSTSRA